MKKEKFPIIIAWVFLLVSVYILFITIVNYGNEPNTLTAFDALPDIVQICLSAIFVLAIIIYLVAKYREDKK